ncbi:virion protein G11 [Wood mouse herpesvirus]|uniref:Virion protein G11 n=1 Tax=Wood mouse herpesvirus TaxID=432370 RepID=D0U1K3_9GAMA|nr:virion protein G11 [Wood mouse herpesvirus]ACY41089.1 virion protein G11 [Wood mouse herpesvirus]
MAESHPWSGRPSSSSTRGEPTFANYAWKHTVKHNRIVIRNARPLVINFATDKLPVLKPVNQIILEDAGTVGSALNLPEESICTRPGLLFFGHYNNAVPIIPIVDFKPDEPLQVVLAAHKTIVVPPGDFVMFILCVNFEKLKSLDLVIHDMTTNNIPLPPTCGQTFKNFNTATPSLEMYGDVLEYNDDQKTCVFTAVFPGPHRRCSLHGPLNFMGFVNSVNLTGGILRVYYSGVGGPAPESILVKFKTSSAVAFSKNPCQGHVPSQDDTVIPLVYTGPTLRLLPMETIGIPFNTSFVAQNPDLKAIIYDNNLQDIRVSPTMWTGEHTPILAHNLTAAVKLIHHGTAFARVAFFSTKENKKACTLKLCPSTILLPGGELSLDTSTLPNCFR